MGDFEVLVCDDGSTDGTAEVEEEYSALLDLTYDYAENFGGPARPRNRGVSLARAPYVAFLDSDDRYLPHKLALQMLVLKRFPEVGMVCSELSCFGEGLEDEFHLKAYHAPAFRNGETYDRYFDRSVMFTEADFDCSQWSERKIYLGQIFDRYLHVLFVCTNTALMRRSVIDEIGFQDEGLPLFEEYEFTLRAAKRYPVAFVDVPTYQLRYHHDQISTTVRPDGPAVLVEKQRQLLKVVDRHGVQDGHYYLAHKPDVDATMAKLHRALGIALMCHPGHESEARAIFSAGRQYGLSAPGFRILTYLPSFVRRIVMKVCEISREIGKRA
jgi:glycosyltransferase involved in cell wall biosynthesis